MTLSTAIRKHAAVSVPVPGKKPAPTTPAPGRNIKQLPQKGIGYGLKELLLDKFRSRQPAPKDTNRQLLREEMGVPKTASLRSVVLRKLAAGGWNPPMAAPSPWNTDEYAPGNMSEGQLEMNRRVNPAGYPRGENYVPAPTKKELRQKRGEVDMLNMLTGMVNDIKTGGKKIFNDARTQLAADIEANRRTASEDPGLDQQILDDLGMDQMQWEEIPEELRDSIKGPYVKKRMEQLLKQQNAQRQAQIDAMGIRPEEADKITIDPDMLARQSYGPTGTQYGIGAGAGILGGGALGAALYGKDRLLGAAIGGTLGGVSVPLAMLLAHKYRQNQATAAKAAQPGGPLKLTPEQVKKVLAMTNR